MNPAQVANILDSALQLSRNMLDAAREENWLEVAQLEAERQKLLMDSLAGESPEKTPLISEKVNQFLVVDQELQQLLVQARNQIRDELIELNKVRDAARAYTGK